MAVGKVVRKVDLLAEVTVKKMDKLLVEEMDCLWVAQRAEATEFSMADKKEPAKAG